MDDYQKYGLDDSMGFTLVEYLVVLVVLSLLLAMAVPKFPELKASFARSNARNSLDFDIRLARAQAISNGKRTVFSVATDGESYEFGFDAVPYNNPLAADGSEFSRPLPKDISIYANKTLAFDNRGFLIDSDGVLTDAAVSIRFKGDEYCSANIFPTGDIEMSCNG
jgi:prepilin-type N-terminal cleavage/methylation domain-containing protein